MESGWFSISKFALTPTIAAPSACDGHTRNTNTPNDAKLNGDAHRRLQLGKQSNNDEDMPFTSEQWG